MSFFLARLLEKPSSGLSTDVLWVLSPGTGSGGIQGLSRSLAKC